LTKGERTRARLLDAAVRRFATDGFRRTSVSDIAREAGLTPAAVYAYFPNKEALFRAAVDDDVAALIERARPPRDEHGLGERWLGMFGRFLAMLPEYPLARRVLAAQEPEVFAQVLELPSVAELRAELVADIEEAQRIGEARDDVNASTLALGLETIVIALVALAIHLPPDPARIQGVREVMIAVTQVPRARGDQQ
jgi:AcrR family transcriptional regulator